MAARYQSTSEETMQVNLKYLQSLAKHIAPKSDIRYYLNGVLLEVTAAGRFYVATDGHKLVAIREARQEGDTIGEWIIPRDVILGIKIQKAGRNPVEHAELEIDGAKAKLDYCGTGAVFAFVDGKFPDWRRVVPQTLSGELAQFNLELLSRIDDIRKAFGRNACDATIHHNGKSCAQITGLHPDALMLVMPCRSNDAQGDAPVPSWARM